MRNLDNVRLVDEHTVMVGEVAVNVRDRNYAVCHSKDHYGRNACKHTLAALAAWKIEHPKVRTEWNEFDTEERQ